MPLAERDALFARYQHLVRVIALSIARKCPPDVDLADLEQSGNLGLLAAIKRYDPARDETFEALCRLRIKFAIVDYLREREPHEQLDESHSADLATPLPPLERQIELSQALAKLEPIARYVIECLYWRAMRAEETGALTGRSGRWVREVEERALLSLGAALGGAENGTRRALRIIMIGLRRKNL